MSAFERLHPALKHHIVNSLGWRALRPLQELSIPPLLEGEHGLLIAPTAGGKTEAAVFPLFSRMLSEDWRGLSVLYVCPIKALLNNLEVRLSRYAELLGRRVELWHGDVGAARRKKIVGDPPDILLTTPESLEVMLIFRRMDRRALFGRVRALVVDELHAFAGDDRGWHLLAVMERVSRIAGREVQRVGLSATIGNPGELLSWLAGSGKGPRRVISPPAEGSAEAEVKIDYVGSIPNAAVVISRLNRGEKRLVFCDSRSRVEKLAAELRQLGVNTFVSHSSLSVDERRRAEQAFAEAHDCVIVATSTLELGLDVGDLDRVIQIDAPGTVASFLQRIGRTGRRPGISRNCLFLATTEMALLQAAGLMLLWSEGYVEPTEPPPAPYHILAQQILALTLQEGAIGRHTWKEWFMGLPGFAALDPGSVAAVIDHMIGKRILFEEEGLLSMGEGGEAEFGRKNFLELVSVFSSPPLFTVLHGREELGKVHEASFYVRDQSKPVLSLAGRSWEVNHIDWNRREAFVEASQAKGRSRWLSGGLPLGYRLCKAMQKVLAGVDPAVGLTSRAGNSLSELRSEFPWVRGEGTALVRASDGLLRWWTFAGSRANSSLLLQLGAMAVGPIPADNLGIEIADDLRPEQLLALLETGDAAKRSLDRDALSPAARADGKFDACLPPALIAERAVRSLLDPAAAKSCLSEGLVAVCMGVD